MDISRVRWPIDDRHAIREPIRRITVGGEERIDIADACIYANTLVKSRIPQLFLTLPGLPGHVTQLQNELNRFKISKMEGCSAKDVPQLITIMKFVRSSVIKSKNASTIPLPNNLFLNFPLISDRIRI